MKIESNKSTTIKLSLTEAEAEWLMGFVQNHPERAQDNSVEKAMRESLFTGLKQELYPNKIAYSAIHVNK